MFYYFAFLTVSPVVSLVIVYNVHLFDAKNRQYFDWTEYDGLVLWTGFTAVFWVIGYILAYITDYLDRRKID